MSNLTRAFKHLTASRAAARRAFPEETLKAIQAAIAAGENQHRAEVRFIVEAALPFADALQGMHARQRARDLFSRYRIWDTEENCGVLVYVNLAERKVELLGDRAIVRALQAKDWQAVCRTMTEGFAHGRFHDAALAGLAQLNDLLRERFPATDARKNQLSDKPIIL